MCLDASMRSCETVKTREGTREGCIERGTSRDGFGTRARGTRRGRFRFIPRVDGDRRWRNGSVGRSFRCVEGWRSWWRRGWWIERRETLRARDARRRATTMDAGERRTISRRPRKKVCDDGTRARGRLRVRCIDTRSSWATRCTRSSSGVDEEREVQRPTRGAQ